MGSQFMFYDYMEEETNLIHKWLHEQPKYVQAKMAGWLNHLEASPPGTWSRPLVDRPL